MNYTKTSPQVDRTLAALADPIRRSLVDRLGHGPQRASDLALASGTSRASMSRHLKLLTAAGILDVGLVADDGRGRRYELRADGLVGLRAWLDQVDTFWSEQLASFADHVAASNATNVDDG